MVWSLAATMDAIATRLQPLAPTVYAWPVREAVPPCAVVGYPADIAFDLVYHDASQEMTFPIWFLVGPVADKATRTEADAVIEGSAKVKAALDGNLGGTVSDARVARARFTQLSMNLVDWLTVEYDLEVMT
jgi:hypothetical protein